MPALRYLRWVFAVSGFVGGSVVLRGASTEVPFDYVRGEILVSVRVGETGPWTMMLDTGTDPSALDLRVARAAGLTLEVPDGGVEGSGTVEVQVWATSIPRVTVGGVEAASIESAVLDLSALGGQLGRPIDGVLGRSFLDGRVVRIDYPARRVRFAEAEADPAVPSATLGEAGPAVVLPLDIVEGMLLLPVQVNGQPARGLLDTGSNGFFKLTPAAVARLHLAEAAAEGTATESTGYRGVARNRTGTVGNIALGTAEFPAPRVVFFGEGSGHDEELWEVNVGNRALERFVVTIDYVHRQLVLVAAEAAPGD